MSDESGTSDQRFTTRRRRWRNVTLVLALLVLIADRVWGTIFLLLREFAAPAVSQLSGLVGIAPIVAFIIATLVRPAVTRRAYWFLPLYFLANAVSAAIFAAVWFFVPMGVPNQIASQLVRRGIPFLAFGIALWVFRPRADELPADDGEPVTDEPRQRKRLRDWIPSIESLPSSREVQTVLEWRGAFTDAELNALHAEAFDHPVPTRDWREQLERHSLGWVVAREDDQLVGFVNVVSDGGVHAFLLDTMVGTDAGRRGIGTALVRTAADEARRAGCSWLHVDFTDELSAFYIDACGFRSTAAGLLQL